MKFQGSYVAIVTPFNADGSVNFDKLRELVNWHLAEGTDGIVALGTTGESSTMSHEEDDLVVRTVLDTVKPCVVGIILSTGIYFLISGVISKGSTEAPNATFALKSPWDFLCIQATTSPRML